MQIPKSYIKSLEKNSNYQKRLLTKVNNNLFLSQEEIEILELYQIPYQSCNSLKELILLIEEIIEEYEIEELDNLCLGLSERDYYFYTNK